MVHNDTDESLPLKKRKVEVEEEEEEEGSKTNNKMIVIDTAHLETYIDSVEAHYEMDGCGEGAYMCEISAKIPQNESLLIKLRPLETWTSSLWIWI